MALGGKEPGTSFRRKMIFVAVVLVLGLAYLLRGVLIPLFLAFLLAYALDPFVDRLEAVRVPRWAGAIIVMLGIATLVGVILFYTVPMFIDEMTDAASTLPDQIRQVQAKVEPWVLTELHIKLPHTMNDLSKAFTERMQSGSAYETSREFFFGTISYVGVVLSVLIVPVFALYLLIDFDRIVARVEQLIPRRFAPPIADVAREIHKTLSGYVRGQLTANIVLAALYATGLRMVDIRLAVPIGVMTGMLAFVPYVGFACGVLVATSMTVLDWHGPGPLVGVLAVMGGVQIIDGMMITPRIVGRSVGLAPLEVILTMMAAGSLFNFLGILLAVPLGAVAKILVQRAVKAYLASEYYNRAPLTPVPAVPTITGADLLTAARIHTSDLTPIAITPLRTSSPSTSSSTPPKGKTV